MSAPTEVDEVVRQRLPQMAEAGRERRSRAWQVARQAAALLKSRYHASRVVAFGSLTHAERFHRWSDVDLAAWGLAPEDYFEAVARVPDIGGDIRLDLVMAERCKPALHEAIRQGVEL